MREDDAPEAELDDPTTDPTHEGGRDSAEGAPSAGPRRRASARAARWLASNSWLVLALGAALVLFEVVEFEAPEQVRLDEASVDLVGEAPTQGFDSQLANPQAVQMRTTLRLYPRVDMDVREVDPKIDAKARILSQPVVTTIYAMNANIDQTVRLDEGKLEIDIELAGTPRLGAAGKNQVPSLSLEHELTVSSRQRPWIGDPTEQIQLHARGTLTDVEARAYRWVFVVEGKLFALDLELYRGLI